jgi:hypothetical protein
MNYSTLTRKKHRALLYAKNNNMFLFAWQMRVISSVRKWSHEQPQNKRTIPEKDSTRMDV